MKRICLLPWFNVHVWAGGAVFCCFQKRPFASYTPLTGGPYAGEDIWNSASARAERGRMLTEGIAGCCRDDCTCSPVLHGMSFDAQAEFYRARYGGDPNYWHCVKASVEDNCTYAHPPTVFNLHFGNLCNACCPMCEVRDTTGPGRIVSPRQVEHLRRLCEKALSVHLGGGDLFALDPVHIAALIAIAPPAAKVETTTNGLGLTLRRWKRFVAARPDPGMTLRVSLDTVDQEAYRLQRGRDVRKVLRNLRAIARAGAGRHGISALFCAVNAWTLPGLPDLVRFAAEVDIPEVTITPTYGRALARQGLGAVDILGDGWTVDAGISGLRVLERAKEAARDTGVRFIGADTIGRLLTREGDR